jgi:PST family polysaccharide transporter
MMTAWWFARKIHIEKVIMSWQESFARAGGLVKLGIALMLSGLVGMFVGYMTRVFITRQISLEAVGIFQVGYRLSDMLINFVLKAMGADFYPRLTAVSSDHQEMNRLINEQTEIGLLLAVPGLIATIVFAPWIIRIFYTVQFLPAVDMMRWFAFGCLGKVASWPMGYILLVQRRSRLFFASEMAFAIVHVVLIWVGLKLFGLTGVAVAFLLAEVFYTVYMLVLSKHLIGFSWNGGMWTLCVFLIFPCVAVLAASLLLPLFPAMCLGTAIAIVINLYCLWQLAKRLGPDHRICRAVSCLPFGSLIIRVDEN